MSIFTQHGEPVRIISRIPVAPMAETICRVQSIDDPSWIREFRAWQLKADGGFTEIVTACDTAPLTGFESHES